MNAYDLSDMYESLGVDIRDMGCVMLDVEPIPIEEIVPPGLEDQLYFSPKEFPYAQGAVGANTGHVTLKWGLLQQAYDIPLAIDRVLGDVLVDLETVKIGYVGMFPSPKPDTDPYSCIVGHLEVGSPVDDLGPGEEPHPLRLANQRLAMLPHVDTYPSFKAHVTLAYVRQEHGTEWRNRLHARFAGRELRTLGLNFGEH